METDIDNPIPTSMDELQEQLETTESNLSQLQSMITSENEKLHKYKVENIRRKHNYIPLIMEMLKILAERGELTTLVDKAIEKRKAAAATKNEAKETEV